MTESVAQSLVNGDCPGHHNCIALDGDKLKPREDQRKGGNGFGINEEGAGSTLTGVDRHGVAYETQVYENHAQDSRIKPIAVSDTRNQKDGTGGNNLPLVCFSKVSHPTAKDGEGERWDEREVAQTRNTFDNGEKRCQEVVVSTNSNGEDVAATINANMSKLGGDNQTTFGGGTASPAERKERTMSHNFELYDNADEVSVSLSAKRVRDTLVVREKEGAEGE